MRAKCPDAAKHTKQPRGYVAWGLWAEAKSKTHEQIQCPGCGRWEIWVKRTHQAAPTRNVEEAP